MGKNPLPYRVVTSYVGLRSGIKWLGPGIKSPGLGGQSYGFMNQRQNSGINAALDLTNLRTLTPKIMFYPNNPKLPSEMFS